MESAPVADTEPQRLAALRSTGLLETPADPAFDELVTLTARLLGAPIAAFNLIDADRQWTKAGAGMANGDEAPRADSFCAHAIAGEGPFVVPDAAADPRFAGNAMGLGFYAGTPVTAGGQRIGTLCVAGDAPHAPSADDLETLRVLAAAITAHVELSRRERERAEESGLLRRLGDATSRLARVSDADELEPELCVAARELVGADGAILWTAAPGGKLRATAAVGSDVVGAELPPGHGAAVAQRLRQRRADLPRARRAAGHRRLGRGAVRAAGGRRPDGGRPHRPLERASRRRCPSASCSCSSCSRARRRWRSSARRR